MSNGMAKGDVDGESFSVKLRIFRNQIAVPESPQNFDPLLDHPIFIAANRFKTFIAQVTKVRQRSGELATRFFIRDKSQIPLLLWLRNESLNYLCFKVFVHVQLGLMWNKKCGGLFGAGVDSVSEEHADFWSHCIDDWVADLQFVGLKTSTVNILLAFRFPPPITPLLFRIIKVSI